MGGSNSGRWGGRPRCESYSAIDVRDWQRRKQLDHAGDVLTLTYTVASGEQRTESVELTRTPCHYGGARVWFRCPSCKRRTAKLYYRRERFLCRQCHGLRYRSQLWGGADRPRLSAQRIRRRLGAEPDLTVPFPPRPNGMPWRTYERLRAKGEHYEMLAFARLADWLERRKGIVR